MHELIHFLQLCLNFSIMLCHDGRREGSRRTRRRDGLDVRMPWLPRFSCEHLGRLEPSSEGKRELPRDERTAEVRKSDGEYERGEGGSLTRWRDGRHF